MQSLHVRCTCRPLKMPQVQRQEISSETGNTNREHSHCRARTTMQTVDIPADVIFNQYNAFKPTGGTTVAQVHFVHSHPDVGLGR